MGEDKNSSIDINSIKEMIKQCIEINNAYIIKHNELSFVYNAYKKLVKKYKFDKKEMDIQINMLLKKYESIGRPELLIMIKQQKDWMKELSQINLNVDNIITEFHEVTLKDDKELKKFGIDPNKIQKN
jgi:hypothetical protein